jgi:hypothetical protein
MFRMLCFGLFLFTFCHISTIWAYFSMLFSQLVLLRLMSIDDYLCLLNVMDDSLLVSGA